MTKKLIEKKILIMFSNNPLIIMDDANIDEAVKTAINGCYSVSGQTPIATGRILVHKEIHREFVHKLVEGTRAVRVSDPLDEEADIGPLNDEQSVNIALKHLDDAKRKGAKILIGGNNPKGFFIEPAVIDEVTTDMLVASEVTLGPLAPILTFETIEEAVEMANCTRFGLQAAAFTSSLNNAFFLGENIKAGAVNINAGTNSWDEMACFGGCKDSGMGRNLSTWIQDEITETKQILLDISKVK